MKGLALLLEFSINSGMIVSKNARAHYGDVDCILGWQKRFSPASCRKEIVNGNERKGIWNKGGGLPEFGRSSRG
jgi:hypothetical protein